MLSLQNSAEYSVDVKFHVRRFKGGRLPFISTKKANLRDWQPRLVLSAPQLWTWPLWKGPGFPQRSRLRPLQEAAQNQVDVSLNAGKPPVYAQGLQVLYYVIQGHRTQSGTDLKGQLAPEPLFPQGVVPPSPGPSETTCTRASEGLSHTRRPLPCDSLLLVPVPPATTFLSALMLSQGGCCPTSLRLPHPGAALGAWTGVGLSSSSTTGWVAS